LLLSLLTVLCILALGGAVGLARCYGPAWLRQPLVFYIDSMRAVPVLVVLVWTYFAFPILTGWSLPPFWGGARGADLHIAAYVAEIVRAGIASVRPGQTRAGIALGMSPAQVVVQIVLPQSIVRMLPAFGSVLSITIKDTAIAAVIAVPEIHEAVGDGGGAELPPRSRSSPSRRWLLPHPLPVTRLVDIVYGRLAHLGRS